MLGYISTPNPVSSGQLHWTPTYELDTLIFLMGWPLKDGGALHFGKGESFTDVLWTHSKIHQREQSQTSGFPDMSL